MKLWDQFINGDKRALARVLTQVDNQTSLGRQIIDNIHLSQIDNGQIIGFTGPPGAGKSTLVNALIGEYRKEDLTVAVLAVDPTSPYTQGAILGDRIRMLEYTKDDGVFIRSVASRGNLGGLSGSTYDMIQVFRKFGFDKIIVETVGAGQSEVDIVKNCDSTVVLTVPGLGDDIQILKAGIMEIADIFVVNKSDKPGAKELQVQIKNMLQMTESNWEIPVTRTSAIEKIGIDTLKTTLDLHWEFLNKHNLYELRTNQIKKEILRKTAIKLEDKYRNSEYFNLQIKHLLNGKITYYQLVNKLLEEYNNV